MCRGNVVTGLVFVLLVTSFKMLTVIMHIKEKFSKSIDKLMEDNIEAKQISTMEIPLFS
jgi:hypothetical protein